MLLTVKLVIAGVGAGFLVSALADWDWYKSFADFAVIEGIFGENAARWVCAFFGLALIGLAVLLFAEML